MLIVILKDVLLRRKALLQTNIHEVQFKELRSLAIRNNFYLLNNTPLYVRVIFFCRIELYSQLRLNFRSENDANTQ